MATIKDTVKYLRDNPKGYWFKNKLYGWGWVPARWQGWLVVAGFIIFLIWNSFGLDSESIPTNCPLVWFFVKVLLAVAVIILICYKKGEKPRWQWGPPKQDS